MLLRREQLLLQVSKLENIQKNLEKADSSKTSALNSFGLPQSLKRNDNQPPREFKFDSKETQRKERKEEDKKESRVSSQKGSNRGREEPNVESREQRRRAEGKFGFFFFLFCN